MLMIARNRDNPSGYKVSLINFADGEPVAPADSNNSYVDIFANANNAVCPRQCFRPVGLAFDKQGRMFVSSDASGEIYVLTREETSNGTSSTGGGSSTGSSPSGGTPESGGQKQFVSSTAALFSAVVAICVMSWHD